LHRQHHQDGYKDRQKQRKKDRDEENDISIILCIKNEPVFVNQENLSDPKQVHDMKNIKIWHQKLVLQIPKEEMEGSPKDFGEKKV
jgi:hypothetical protein